MSNPVYISTNDAVRIVDPYVIFYQLVPQSVAWDNTAQVSYYMVNSTGQDIRFTDGSFYYDANSVLKTSLASGASLLIIKNDLNNWLQSTTPNDIIIATGGDISATRIPIATSLVLGGIKVGNNLTITNDGTLSAIGGSGSVDWIAITGKPTFALVATTGLYSDLIGIPTFATIATTGQYSDLIGAPILATVATTGDYADLVDTPAINFDSLTTSGTSGPATLVSGTLNIPEYAGAGTEFISSITTDGVTGVATVVAGVLNVPNYTSGSAIPTSIPLASILGILTDGSDQTTALNTIFGNSLYSGIVIDFSAPAAITISGTVNATGKIIRFVGGSYFTGAGTINNAIIDADYKHKIADTSVSFTASAVASDYFSAMWYGASPSIGDSAPAIQKAINTSIANPLINTVFIPSGNYSIGSPLIMMNWNGSVYGQQSTNLFGEGKFWQGGTGGTRLTCTFRDTFALGIQAGKGNQIRGIHFKGIFTPPAFTDYQFYTANFASFTDGVSRDTRYSPYSGIVIDPFGSAVPADGGYPGLTADYRGNSGGSTGTEIIDCIVSNFVCGMITSPNGTTANAELQIWDKIQFANCKACIAATQTQEKMNIVTNTACWSDSHTFFENQTYGLQVPGHWIIKGVNIAGKMNRFINRNDAGYFPMHISDVYAESIGTVGRLLTSNGDTMINCTFNFVTPDVVGAYPNYPTTCHFEAPGVTIKNTQMRYYGWYIPLVLIGGLYEDCAFDQMPYGVTTQFVNSGCAGGPLGQTYDYVGITVGATSRVIAGGRGKIFKNQEYIQGKQISLNFTDYVGNGWLNIDNLAQQASTFTVTFVGGNANVATVTPPGGAADCARVIIGRLVFDWTSGGVGQLLGVVTAVGATTYTVAFVPDGVVSGNYVIQLFCPAQVFSFMGTCTAGSPNITGVTIDFGDFTDLQNYGGGYVKLPNFYGFRSYTQGARILSYNSGTGTIVMDRAARDNATNYYFSSNSAVKEIDVKSINNSGFFSGSGLSNTEIMPKGSKWYIDTPAFAATGRREYIITQTGFYNSAPQATWCELTSPWCTTTTTTTTT